MAVKNIILEDCRILFRNFEGKEKLYNAEGDRNFCVIIPEDRVEELVQIGWPVKRLKPRQDDPDAFPEAYLEVKVGFKGSRPPRIVMIMGNRKKALDERTCSILDWQVIEKVDLTINPSEWTINGKSGIKPYLKSIFVTVEVDELERKYMDYEDEDDDYREQPHPDDPPF